jgi:hypothetical protein
MTEKEVLSCDIVCVYSTIHVKLFIRWLLINFWYYSIGIVIILIRDDWYGISTVVADSEADGKWLCAYSMTIIRILSISMSLINMAAGANKSHS